MEYDVPAAKRYLEDGGLGETLGFALMAAEANRLKVQMDTDMAVALCHLADEALKSRTTNHA